MSDVVRLLRAPQSAGVADESDDDSSDDGSRVMVTLSDGDYEETNHQRIGGNEGAQQNMKEIMQQEGATAGRHPMWSQTDRLYRHSRSTAKCITYGGAARSQEADRLAIERLLREDEEAAAAERERAEEASRLLIEQEESERKRQREEEEQSVLRDAKYALSMREREEAEEAERVLRDAQSFEYAQKLQKQEEVRPPPPPPARIPSWILDKILHESYIRAVLGRTQTEVRGTCTRRRSLWIRRRSYALGRSARS
eukprot:1176157-Prorocentrum_minimum.AAC.4